MIVALSSGLSWLIFGALAVFAVFVALVYIVDVGASWLDEAERRLDEPRTFTEPADPNLRIFGGVYDHEARGDFE